MYSFIAGFILLALLLFVIYRNYKVKARANEILEQKNEEIQAQRDEIEAQRDTATTQRDKIARQNRIITESMEYAGRIQNAVLPQESLIKSIFFDYFFSLNLKILSVVIFTGSTKLVPKSCWWLLIARVMAFRVPL